MNSEIEQFLEEKKKELMDQFMENKAKAQVFMRQKQIAETSLKQLVNKGSMIAAKMAAIIEMLKE